MTTLEVVQRMVPAVARAIEAAVTKHGRLPSSYERALLIVQEEMGEVAEALLGLTHPTAPYRTEANLIDEHMDLLAAIYILIMVHSGIEKTEGDTIDFHVDPDMKVH